MVQAICKPLRKVFQMLSGRLPLCSAAARAVSNAVCIRRSVTGHSGCGCTPSLYSSGKRFSGYIRTVTAVTINVMSSVDQK